MHCWCSNIPLGSTLILFVTLVAAAQNSQDNCTYALLTECSNNLNAYLGIDEPRPWEQPVSWRGKVEQLFELEAVEGLRKLCRGFREMKDCLRGCYRDLFSLAFLVNGDPKVDINSGYTFMSTINSFHYLCGAGFGTFLSNQACIVQTWQDHRTDIEKCRSDFESISNEQPDLACSFANTLLSCYENYFKSGCGDGARDAQFFGCEYARTAVFSRFPQCPLACSSMASIIVFDIYLTDGCLSYTTLLQGKGDLVALVFIAFSLLTFFVEFLTFFAWRVGEQVCYYIHAVWQILILLGLAGFSALLFRVNPSELEPSYAAIILVFIGAVILLELWCSDHPEKQHSSCLCLRLLR